MVNPELINYIKKVKEKGYTHKHIKEHLIEHGYKHEHVNEAFNHPDLRERESKIKKVKKTNKPNKLILKIV